MSDARSLIKAALRYIETHPVLDLLALDAIERLVRRAARATDDAPPYTAVLETVQALKARYANVSKAERQQRYDALALVALNLRNALQPLREHLYGVTGRSFEYIIHPIPNDAVRLAAHRAETALGTLQEVILQRLQSSPEPHKAFALLDNVAAFLRKPEVRTTAAYVLTARSRRPPPFDAVFERATDALRSAYKDVRAIFTPNEAPKGSKALLRKLIQQLRVLARG